jgi:xanthine dehydrogenase accessory factor
MNIYEIICDYLDKNKTGILATVIKRTGSAPRDVGAKMFVGEDGKSFGTVGGGLLEAGAYKEAIAIMGKNVIKTFSVSMDADTVSAKDMLCGGDVTVLLEPVTMKHFHLYQQIKTLQETRRRGLVVTGFGENTFTKALLDKEGNITGNIPDSHIIDRVKALLYEKRPVLNEGYFVDPIRVSFPLYLFGAGHVSQYVAKIAKIADFHITVIDDRREFANNERFPGADAIMLANIPDAFRCLEFSGNEYIVILTRSHEYDAAALEETLEKEVKYVGMIGSKRKVRIILDNLKEKGFSESAIERVHAPIGMPIDAETPQEIAISIVAELVTIKNKSQRPQPGNNEEEGK